jgi:hypothetical protein
MTLVNEIDASLAALEAEVGGEVMRVVGDTERLVSDVLHMLATFDSDASAHHAMMLVREALDLVRNAQYGALADVPRDSSEIRRILRE